MAFVPVRLIALVELGRLMKERPGCQLFWFYYFLLVSQLIEERHQLHLFATGFRLLVVHCSRF